MRAGHSTATSAEGFSLQAPAPCPPREGDGRRLRYPRLEGQVTFSPGGSGVGASLCLKLKEDLEGSAEFATGEGLLQQEN